jgi:hypothetical protein
MVVTAQSTQFVPMPCPRFAQTSGPADRCRVPDFTQWSGRSIDHWCETPTVAKVAQWSGQAMTVGPATQRSEIDPMVIAWAQAQWSFFLPDKSVGHGPGTKWARDGHDGPDVTKPALGGLC